MTSTEIALAYIRANLHASKRSIGKVLSEKYPEIWHSQESGRSVVKRLAPLIPEYNPKINCSNHQRILIKDPFVGDILPHIKTLPKVLLLDIETAPILLYSWGLFKPHLTHDNIVRDWFMLSWAAKWLHRPDVFSDVVTTSEAMLGNDKRICESVFKLMEEAEVIIAHNGKRFDIRKIQARFLIHGIPRPSPFQVIDTLLESRKNFAHSSHRLDYLGQILVRREKLETDYKLWKKCLQGCQESLNYMDEYCRNDIFLLEDVYMEIRGWIKSHPNMNLYVETDVPVCPTCASDKLDYCGEYVTMAGAFRSFRCGTCGSIGRERKSSLTPKDRDRLRLSVAR